MRDEHEEQSFLGESLPVSMKLCWYFAVEYHTKTHYLLY